LLCLVVFCSLCLVGLLDCLVALLDYKGAKQSNQAKRRSKAVNQSNQA
jgi:hypothetical protein